jgi:hypothetical protein
MSFRIEDDESEVIAEPLRLRRIPEIEEDVLKRLLEDIYENPDLLLGSGSAHEEMFEKLVKERGIDYARHPNGTQQSPDFVLFGRWSIELKSTKSDRIVLNDGFFVDDVIYIISRTTKKGRDSIIALGRDVYQKEEKEMLIRYREQLETIKKEYKDLPKAFNLTLYPRSANQFRLKELDRVRLFDLLKTELE